MNYRCYTNDKYKKNIQSAITGVNHRDDMQVEVVKNATFVVDTKDGAFGIFDTDGVLVKTGLQFRGPKCNFIPKFSKATEYIDADAMFLGNVFYHFGHFLLEQLNRAWAIREYARPGMKFVFVDYVGQGAKSWVYDFAKLLGIQADDLIILDKTVRFRSVLVPSQSMNLSGKWQAKEFIGAFDIIRDNVIGDAKSKWDKVYVSRAKLPDDMRTYGEEKIQQIFEKNGFKVIYPETLPLAEQVKIIGGASVLAGCAGTALHMALFMRPGGRVIQLNRSLSVRDSGGFQYRMCELRGLGLDIVSASIEKTQSQHGGDDHAPQIIGITKYLKQYFDENGFVCDLVDYKPDEKAWQQYEAQMKEFKKAHGSSLMQNVKKVFIRIVSCVVPGRVNRKRLRNWLKEHL